VNRVDPTGHADQDAGDLCAWWDKFTPVYIFEHIQDDVEQHKALVDFMFEHPDYDPSQDPEIIEAGWDPGSSAGLLSVYKFLAGAQRLELRQMGVGEFWATYGTLMVAAGMVLKGGPSQSPIWNNLEAFQGKIRTNGVSGKGRQYYRWDYTHGDIEVYDRNGFYRGSIDPLTGEMYRPATGSQLNRNVFK